MNYELQRMSFWKGFQKYSFILALVLIFVGCRKNEPGQEATVIGSMTMDLDASKNLIRKKEALIGNFVTDAIAETVRTKGHIFDFFVINSGAIRFDQLERPSGIYPAGNITNQDIDEMLPFGDLAVIVTLTGTQIKEILERSVAQLPLAQGPFLQISKELRIEVDTLAAEQQINVEGTAIVSPGERITSIKINDVTYDPEGIYRVLVINFIADGGDGYVTLKNLPSAQKVILTEFLSAYVKEYVIINSPITTVLDGRITYI